MLLKGIKRLHCVAVYRCHYTYTTSASSALLSRLKLACFSLQLARYVLLPAPDLLGAAHSRRSSWSVAQSASGARVLTAWQMASESVSSAVHAPSAEDLPPQKGDPKVYGPTRADSPPRRPADPPPAARRPPPPARRPPPAAHRAQGRRV